MSIPTPPSVQRSALDANLRQITRTLLPTLENLTGFDDFLQTIPSDPEALTQEPYSYTTDEAYAIRLWGQHAAAFAALFGAGGTLSGADAATLADLTRRFAGATVYVNQGV